MRPFHWGELIPSVPTEDLVRFMHSTRFISAALLGAAAALFALGSQAAPLHAAPPARGAEVQVPAPPRDPAERGARANWFVGTWSGEIRMPGQGLAVSIALDAAAPGPDAEPRLRGTIDIPSQSLRGAPLEVVLELGTAPEPDRVRMVIKGLPGNPTFRGARRDAAAGTDGGETIEGQFEQSAYRLPFSLKRGALAKRVRPQDPAPPFPYTEVELTAAHGEGDGAVSLSGTLTVPAGAGPFPCAILVSGSGQQNRDEELFDHRPFLVIADHLTRAGIAVLRYDDRGVGASTGPLQTATSVDFAVDSEAWISVLKARPEIGPIGIIGHSEGGLIAPLVAARNADVAFIVLLAGPGVPGSKLLAAQQRALAESGQTPPEVAMRLEATSLELYEAVAAAPLDEPLPDHVATKLAALIAVQRGTPPPPPDAEGNPTVITREVADALRQLSVPWMRLFLSHDPSGPLRAVRVPILALNGTRDVQVVAEQNLPAIEAVLKESGHPDFSVRRFEGLNHLFQPSVSGGVIEYAQIETTVDPAVLEAMRAWIAERFVRTAPAAARP